MIDEYDNIQILYNPIKSLPRLDNICEENIEYFEIVIYVFQKYINTEHLKKSDYLPYPKKQSNNSNRKRTLFHY